MAIQAWCKTDKGLRRENNQDSYLVNSQLGLYIVADGMGGHQGGEVASALAVKTVETVIEQNKSNHQIRNPRDLLSHAYSAASEKIFERASENGGELLGMGTTMVCAYAYRDTLYIGNVGDSRGYLFRNPLLWQVTEDHSLINEQLQAGIITEDQVQDFAQKNVITRSVGFERHVAADIIERKLIPGELYLFCSDGLSGMVTDELIGEILSKNPVDMAVDMCIKQALASGGHDNVTVMLLKVV